MHNKQQEQCGRHHVCSIKGANRKSASGSTRLYD